MRSFCCSLCSHFDNCFFSLSIALGAFLFFYIHTFRILCVSTLCHILLSAKLFGARIYVCMLCSTQYYTVVAVYIPWRKWCAKLTTKRKSKNKNEKDKEMCSRMAMEMKRKEILKFWHQVSFAIQITCDSHRVWICFAVLLAAFVQCRVRVPNKRFLRTSEHVFCIYWISA